MKITFGTEGWRGIIGDEFTFTNLRRVSKAIAGYLISAKLPPRVVVGYDTRFLSNEFALAAAEVLKDYGLKVILAAKPVPSPVLAFTARKINCLGVMVTASHNPPKYNGLKLKGHHGGPLAPEVVVEIEGFIDQPVNLNKTQGSLDITDFWPDYLTQVEALVDFAAIRRANFKVVVDPMHGAAGNVFARLLEEKGVMVQEIRGEINPSFGGINPEPIPFNLTALVDAVKEFQADLGLATDGDGDRLGIIDPQGQFVSPHYFFALLLKHLVNRKESGGVVKTFSTTVMIDLLADKYQIPCYETPVGFKYISEVFKNRDILLGGEESGGLGFRFHLPERDGILTGLLVLEAMAVTGKGIKDLIYDLQQEIGCFFYDRLDLNFNSNAKEAILKSLLVYPPNSMAGYSLEGIKNTDGVKYLLGDLRWVLFRFSGTEPVLRIYCEARSPQEVKEIMAEAMALIKDGERHQREIREII